MWRLAIDSAWQHRRRSAGTVLAVALGVAFLVATLVVGDTFAANFDRLFSDTAAGTDVVVRNATSVSDEPDARRGGIDAALVGAVERIDGVAVAVPEITGYGQLLDATGEPLGGNGPPRIAGTWIDDPDLNPYQLVEGRPPSADDEVVVNRGVAITGDLAVGDRTVVQTPRPVDVTIVGIATFGEEDGFGQTTYTAFTLDGARRNIVGGEDVVTDILVGAEPGTDAGELQARIAQQLPDGVEAITGADLVDERLDTLGFLTIIRAVLVGFAAIALLVATVSIHNTFEITAAQRRREVALLRSIGATRGQVRRLLRAEAVTIGATASLAGAAAGVGLALLLEAVFDAFGSGLPDGGLTVRPVVIVAGVAVGVVVAVLAARGPARHAGNTAPVAALRDGGIDRPLRPMRALAGAGALVAAAGIIGAAAVLVEGDAVALTSLAVVGIVAGALALAPFLLAAGSHRISPLARRVGIGSEMAVENMARQPRRSAGAATALIIGVAIVAVFTVFAASATTAVDEQVTDGFGNADLAVTTPAFGGGLLSLDIIADVTALETVETATGTATAAVRVDGEQATVTATGLAALEPILAADVVEGTIGPDRPAGVVVDTTTAAEHGWGIGSRLDIGFADGTTEAVAVAAIVADQPLLDGIIVETRLWSDHEPQAAYNTVYLTLADGAAVDAARAELEPVADRYTGSVQDRAELADARAQGFQLLLGVVYVMLALAIIIALAGIANTLSLSIHERRRELGLLRAVGQTRRQTRRTLRIESILIATFGTVTGCAVGAVCGVLVFDATFDQGRVDIPIATLAVIVAIGIAAGAAAAWRAGRRAAQVPILDAIGSPT